jgi:two-component system NtrC family response regulator
MGRILVVEDDEALKRVAQGQLERNGHQTAAAMDVAEALDVLRRQPVDLVLSDLHLPDMSGMELLKRVRMEYPETAVVIMTAYGTIETAIEATRMGAYDYITKPIHPDELKTLVNRVLERRQLIDEVRVLRSTVDEKYGFQNIIGRSPSLMQVLESAALVANSDATVLIRGETGTGKELLAKAIHFNSLRRERPFVIINCGSIPRELLESELFGHVKGSFTGALAHKRGKVETADGGTVMLDEIGEMPLELQVRILRLVEEHEIEKVGGTAPIKVDVRILAATHRDLESSVAQGAFREDLYYRLSVIPLTLPPLRERPEDVPVLLDHFFQISRLKHGRPGLRLPPSLKPYFVNYSWPGNVREMENLLERLVLLARSDEITANDLPEHIRGGRTPSEHPKIAQEYEGMSLEAVEREMIVQALRKFNWNQTQAAHYLDISRKTLMYRIAKYGIEKESFGQAGSARDETT